MRVAIRAVSGHLVWSATGTVWGFWRLGQEGSRFSSELVRRTLLERITSLVRSLDGSPRLYSVCAQVDAGEIGLRMREGLDAARHDAAAETVFASLDMLKGAEMHRRAVWLAVPLKAAGRGGQWSRTRGALWAQLGEQLGLPASPVPVHEVQAFRAAARQVENGFGGGLDIRPARAAEIVWLHQHAVHRGMAEPLLSLAEAGGQMDGRVVGAVLRSPSYAQLGQVRLLEGGVETSADEAEAEGGPGRGWRRGGVGGPGFRRLWLQVETEDGFGYQAHLALEEIPEAVSQEAADILAQLEQLPYPVDAVLDLTIVDSAKAKRAIAKKRAELVDQADQWAAHPSGAPDTIGTSVDVLGEQDARLGRTAVECEVQSRTVLTVWGPDAQTCDARARDLKARLSGASYRAIRPYGGQERLFSLGLPASGPALRAREVTQFQLSEDFALNGLLTGSDIGDAAGPMLGLSLDVGTARPVLLDLAGAPLRNTAASLAVIGDLGSGKSVALKLLTSQLVDRGHRAVVIDRTPLKEWASFARAAAAGRCQVVDAAHAQRSIDPLRVLPRAAGEAAALSYLTLQLNLGPVTEQGAVISRAVKAAAASAEPSMARVLQEVASIAAEGGVHGEEAAGVLNLLRVIAENPLAAMVFDPSLPALDLTNLTADMVVFTTAGLTLPLKAALTNPDLMRMQPVEALIGRAVLYLVAALSRHIAFADARRFAAIVMDECYWLTSSGEGHALVEEIAHDGRKHWAGMMLGGHDANDLGNETVRGLITYRLLARTSDQAMARRGLELVGLPAEDEALVQTVTSGLSPAGVKDRAGEMLLRDSHGRIGRIKVVVPEVERLTDGIFTTPGGTPQQRSPRPGLTGVGRAASLQKAGRR
ncbi:ATP-binding protein [Streptomyces sp. NRRL B-24484]|uniref:ATP-binding protein n=1 Tax=Streptomyces sp. NRRL B-24484 TaxID=1463833 RepID=UPI0005BA3634|nr:ATP-binding protein [Streptomyces sp. NRRL B-24484]